MDSKLISCEEILQYHEEGLYHPKLLLNKSKKVSELVIPTSLVLMLLPLFIYIIFFRLDLAYILPIAVVLLFSSAIFFTNQLYKRQLKKALNITPDKGLLKPWYNHDFNNYKLNRFVDFLSSKNIWNNQERFKKLLDQVNQRLEMKKPEFKANNSFFFMLLTAVATSLFSWFFKQELTTEQAIDHLILILSIIILVWAVYVLLSYLHFDYSRKEYNRLWRLKRSLDTIDLNYPVDTMNQVNHNTQGKQKSFFTLTEGTEIVSKLLKRRSIFKR